jgi:hypothetical protein
MTFSGLKIEEKRNFFDLADDWLSADVNALYVTYL